MQKISSKTVAKMQPGDTISDSEIRGFSARRWDTGAVTYSLRYRTRNGDRKRILIGQHGNITPDEARKIAKQRAAKWHLATIPLPSRRSPRQSPVRPWPWCGMTTPGASW
jgi:hypothetical protein